MKIPFISKRKYWYSLSGILIAASIVFLLIWGLKPGIDFTGGSLLEIKFNQTRPTAEALQESLTSLDLGFINIQPAGDEGYILRMKELDEIKHQEVISVIQANFAGDSEDESGDVIEQLRFESIGPTIGQELKSKSVVAIILTLIFIILYIAYVFRKVSYPVASWKYGLTAIIALAHDILLLLGFFSVLGHFFGYEINIYFITALLTTLGYSVNDTIVVFDRTRENQFLHKDQEFSQVVNDSVNQTLNRSLNTSFTTLLVLLAVYLFGGDSIKEFVLALIFGAIVGTYSSIFIASPLLVDWQKWFNKTKN